MKKSSLWNLRSRDDAYFLLNSSLAASPSSCHHHDIHKRYLLKTYCIILKVLSISFMREVYHHGKSFNCCVCGQSSTWHIARRALLLHFRIWDFYALLWPVKVFRHANVITKPVRKRQDFLVHCRALKVLPKGIRRSKKDNPDTRKWSPLFEIPINWNRTSSCIYKMFSF